MVSTGRFFANFYSVSLQAILVGFWFCFPDVSGFFF